MTDGPAGGLVDLLDDAVTDLADVKRHEGVTGVEWSTGEVVFAAASGDRAEFRLAPPIVAAALRTPNARESARGQDWVAFAPSELDGHAIDRAVAWLASAWRRASAGR